MLRPSTHHTDQATSSLLGQDRTPWPCSVHVPLASTSQPHQMAGEGALQKKRKTLPFEILSSNKNHLLSRRTVSLNTPNPCLKELLTAQVGS